MNPDYQKIESDLSDLLTAMTSFTPSEVAEVERFLAVGEYGLAFETLCGIIKEEGRSVSSEVRPKIGELGDRMIIDPNWWKEIAEKK